ncbi:MAG: DUF4062 domain-containing protein, partial [Proteobacteria bacterium]|nr:DUF4062 domain-containing protein [Pseudomonadota bacterium]
MEKKGNVTTRKSYKVFLSSTSRDNEKRRKIVQDAITSAGMVWDGMEIFTAETKPTKEVCLKYAAEADLFVGIIAWRYGWQPDGDKSITEMEYDAARAAGKDCLMFQLNPDLPVNQKDFDEGENKWDKQKLLAAFKKRFAENQLPAYFDETNLGTKALVALNKWKETHEQEGKPEEEAASTKITDVDLSEEIESYGQKADALYAHLPVAGFVTQLKVPIDIEEIYVPIPSS